MDASPERERRDGGPPLRGEQKREIKWLSPCAAAAMAIGLAYLAYRTKIVFSSQDTTLIIWATLAIEIATAGKPNIVESSSRL